MLMRDSGKWREVISERTTQWKNIQLQYTFLAVKYVKRNKNFTKKLLTITHPNDCDSLVSEINKYVQKLSTALNVLVRLFCTIYIQLDILKMMNVLCTFSALWWDLIIKD